MNPNVLDAPEPENEAAPVPAATDKPQWSKPEITSFAPLSDAAGISYRPGDGISNQSF
jgi:hypothetical protein